MEELRGRTALLTGAAGGLGTYIAMALVGEGVRLAISDLEGELLSALAEQLRGAGAEATPLGADLTDTEQTTQLVDRAEKAIGPLDVLINNAGLEFGGSFVRSTPEELAATTQVNFLATMLLTRAALPGMIERGRGHVVNMASLAGKGAFPYLASYCGTKHAVVGFTHALRLEYGDQPVGFSAICPGFIGRVGMYGRLEGLLEQRPPWGLRAQPPERVGEAVIKAIRENRPEVWVAQRGTKPALLSAGLAPRLADRALRNRRALRFAEGFARARGRL